MFFNFLKVYLDIILDICKINLSECRSVTSWMLVLRKTC